ncbi:hypothetical protein DTO169E5_9028 [Paecilomyces variotii]|nr:hypothetical protein DTO169E5_9028 [Paecilomyces variotii]
MGALETSESHSSPNHQAEQTWESLLLPPNGGLLRVKQGNGTTAQYGLSMFHQLHCLIVLRGLLFPGTSQNHEHSTSPSNTGKPHQDSVHWAHCLDYIAQGILCAADDTIEPPRRVKNEHGEHTVVVDGVGHTHQCRDPVSLWQAVMNSETHPIDLSELRKGEGLRSFLGDNNIKPVVDLHELPVPYHLL